MKAFKDRLKEELRQDAPFTTEIKQRILQPKQMKRRINWRVLSVSIAACFIIGLMLSIEFFQQNSLHILNKMKGHAIFFDMSPQEHNVRCQRCTPIRSMR